MKKFREVRKLSADILWSEKRRNPQLEDLGLISLALTLKFMDIESENHLFHYIPNTI